DSEREIGPAGVLIFEGIHTFYDARVRDLLDLKLFVKVDPDICLLRRVQRDILERGRQIDDISEQYLATVKPMYERYVRGYEEYADVIVTRGGRGQRIADVLACYINQEISGETL
ncbi:MAG: uridine kinase, partial [Clostridia bacterium]|nr:uridine kinase [Clostridia bacterium]